MTDKWGRRLWYCPEVEFWSVYRHDGWEKYTLPQWPSMTKVRSVAMYYAKDSKYHLVWSCGRRFATSSFYVGVDVALREGGEPWDVLQPEISYEYAKYFAVWTKEEVSSCKFLSLFQFQL